MLLILLTYFGYTFLCFRNAIFITPSVTGLLEFVHLKKLRRNNFVLCILFCAGKKLKFLGFKFLILFSF